MQNYINPIELLNINTEISSGVDGVTIRKAKKSLLAEIELSDTDSILHKGVELTKSDCLKAIDDLDNKDKKDFHFFVYQNKDLSNFLTNGDLTFFKTYKVESIYKLPEFVDFVSPYFSLQFAKALSKNFKSHQINNVKLLLSVKPIVNIEYYEDCYKSTYLNIKEIENEVIETTKGIRNQTSNHIADNFNDLPSEIRKKVDVDLLNILPPYFQSLRNQFAETTKILAVIINNAPYSKYKPAFEMIEIANAIQTDGLAKQKIIESFFIIKKNYESSLPKTANTTYQQSTQPKVATVEIDNDGEAENEITQVKEEKKEGTNIYYWLFLSVAHGVGFFYSPVQKVILCLSLLTLLIPLVAFRKDSDFSIRLFLKRNAAFIAAALLGFFYAIIAQLFVSYFFFVYFNLLFDAITGKGKVEKHRFIIGLYLVGAAVVTFLYHDSKPITIASNMAPKTEVPILSAEEDLTDKQLFEKGNFYLSQPNFDAALISFDKAIHINSNYADAYVGRGTSKAHLGQYQKAISDFEKAEELGLRTSTLYSNWGYAHYQLKKLKEALTYLEKALKIDPDNDKAYRWRGDIKYDKNDNKGAADDYSKAINANPEAANYFARGLAYYYLKEYQKAIQDMDKAIQLKPDNAQYYFDRGDAKDLNNDFDGACRDWKTAKEKGYDVPDHKINRCTPQIVYVPNGVLSGCDAIQPKYGKALNNKLLITVGNNASVAVKLINISSGKCIRYVFINKGSSYSVKNIPQGKYYLKIAYGNDWSILDGQPACTGRFTKNTLFEKGEDILDYNLIYSGNKYQVPSFSLKLDVSISENDANSFNTDKIDENSFYNE